MTNAPPVDDARVTRCMLCRDTKRVRIDLPRDAWIPMKDGTYEVLSGDTHECVRGVSQAIIKPCPMCTAPSPTADQARLQNELLRLQVGPQHGFQGPQGTRPIPCVEKQPRYICQAPR